MSANIAEKIFKVKGQRSFRRRGVEADLLLIYSVALQAATDGVTLFILKTTDDHF